MLINPAGLVFIGRRAGGIEHVDESHVWQMPQGGVDPGEDTWAAAKRELYEETSVRSVEKLGEIADWLIYDIPRTVAGRAWKGRYRGQRQKWYAVRFTGKDDEINVASPGGPTRFWLPTKNIENNPMQGSRQSPARMLWAKYLTRRANQRHSFIIAQSVKRPWPRNNSGCSVRFWAKILTHN